MAQLISKRQDIDFALLRRVNLQSTVIYVVLLSVFCVGGIVGCSSNPFSHRLYLRNNVAALNQPHNPQGQSIRIEVPAGMPARLIGEQLVIAGLIGDARLFEAYVRVNGLADRLVAGTYILSPTMTLPEIAEALQNTQAATLLITFPEGWRFGQMVDHLRSLQIFNDEEMVSYEHQVTSGQIAHQDAADYPFLSTRPLNTGLEGYLFPDTYEVILNAPTADSILSHQLKTFQRKVMPLYEKAEDEGNTTLDLYTVLTLASIVEREAVIPDERPIIAGVYLNRLAEGMKLQADPTVQYAMGYQPESKQWWKTPVFLEEYSTVLSPYNTYLYAGLPPGPIANPGISSIEAVLYPESHNFLYFVAVPEQSGRHVFARTFEEHEQNVQQYLRGG
ncbi:MAG: endolytic transglycosylase MltG [Chloroflexota bacterium]